MEWTSLVAFSVLSEVAVGVVLAYALVAARHAKLGRSVFLTAWVLTGLATVASLFHLGWPLAAYRVLGGLGSSWLSWEVVLTGLFGAGSLMLWWRSRSGAVPPVFTAVLSLVGLAAVVASGMIYTLPAIPANDNLFPPALFLATALATGGAMLLVLVGVTKTEAPELSGPLALMTLGALVLTAVLNVVYPTAAAGGVPEAQLQAAAFTDGVWYALRLLIGLLVPAGLLVWLARAVRRPGLRVMAPALAVAAVVVLGELAGRFLFFSSTVNLMFGQ